jgi:hypothetical protein
MVAAVVSMAIVVDEGELQFVGATSCYGDRVVCCCACMCLW